MTSAKLKIGYVNWRDLTVLNAAPVCALYQGGE
jgi:hypothetical protein